MQNTNKKLKGTRTHFFAKSDIDLDYIDQTTNFCKKNGFVETLFGRKCYIEGINNKNPSFKNFAIRAAVNAPIQGSAADIIKKAMIKIDNYLDYLEGLSYKPKKLTNKIGNIQILKNKKSIVFFDVGQPPKKKFSSNYQSGPLSFEYFFCLF